MSLLEIGIDPGKSGGLAARFSTGEQEVHPMPETEHDLTELLADIVVNGPDTKATAYVEEVGGYVGQAQPGSAMFKFGRNFGYILGTLAALDVTTVLIKPQAWQKQLRLGAKSGRTPTEWKNHLKAEAQRRFPNLKVTLKTADALLILSAGKHFV